MGHIVTSPLPEFASLSAASAHAARLFGTDAVPAFAPVFAQLPFGPVAVYSSGVIREAEYIGRPDGFTWVVAQ